MKHEFETIDSSALAGINGGNWVSDLGNDAKNLGKAAVNGGANAINFLHDHPIDAGKFGTFSVGGGRVQKPFTDDPLSKVG